MRALGEGGFFYMNLTPDMGAKPEENSPATNNLYTIMYTVFLL